MNYDEFGKLLERGKVYVWRDSSKVYHRAWWVGLVSTQSRCNQEFIYNHKGVHQRTKKRFGSRLCKRCKPFLKRSDPPEEVAALVKGDEDDS